MTLALIVALALAGFGAYGAYRNPSLGAALLVGLAILTALYMIWDKDPSVFQKDPSDAPAVPVPTVQGSHSASPGATGYGVPIPRGV